MCANTYNPRQAGPIQAVALTPVNDSYYKDFTLEPPMVRIRSQNSGYLYLSSRDIIAKGMMPNNCTITLPGQGQILSKVKRMGVQYIRWKNATPTINPINKLLRVYRQDTGSVQDVVLTEGFYDHPQALMTMLKSRLDAVTGLVWTITPPPPYTSQKIWGISTTVNVYFLWDSPAVKYGLSTFGFQTADGPEFKGSPTSPADLAEYQNRSWRSSYIGPMNCCYTRYIDIRSNVLTAWTKNPNSGTKFGANNIITRLYLPEFDYYTSDPGTYSAPIYQPLRNFAFTSDSKPGTFTMNPDESIGAIDIQIYDEYGNLYYVPPVGPFTGATSYDGQGENNVINYNGGLEYDIVFYTEI